MLFLKIEYHVFEMHTITMQTSVNSAVCLTWSDHDHIT